MWLAVTRRFYSFHTSLLLLDNQIEDGVEKVKRIGNALEVAYGNIASDSPPILLVGSWGKQTQVRPSEDIDIMAVFSWPVYTRFEERTGNKQSQFLQEVRGHLQSTFSQTEIRGDGQVVVVAFNNIAVEVVPVFRFDDGRFLMPDTNNGGRWKIVHPQAQIDSINGSDIQFNGNVRPLIRMIKMWKRHNNIQLKSFLIELLVCDFLQSYQFSRQTYYYFDWMIRDFFIFLRNKAGGQMAIPGTTDIVRLGTDWTYRVDQAIVDAHEACLWERADYDVTAGQEWQKIFGPRIPKNIF
jgi:hypothetical protein